MHQINHLKNKIIHFLKQNKKVFSYQQIFSFLKKDCSFYLPFQEFQKAINELIKTKEIILIRHNLIKIGYPKAEIDHQQIYQGTIRINLSLNGFITKNLDQESKYFVHKSNLGGAIDGDIVEFGVLKMPYAQEPTKLIDVKVIKILQRQPKHYVALKKDQQIICDDPKIYLPLAMENDWEKIQSNEKFLFSIVKWTNELITIKLEKILGNVNDRGIDILSLIYSNEIEPEFPQQILDETKQICAHPAIDNSFYQPLQNLDFVTIDPTDSKDYDDAIYVEKNHPHFFKLFVAIADVSSFVKFQSHLDIFASKRSCSVYLPDRVVPMLPFEISDDVCSLLPNQERYSLVCEMKIDLQGQIMDKKIYPAIIKSKKRFSYDEVNNFFESTKQCNFDQKIGKMLLHAQDLHQIIAQKRIRNGYFNIELPEPKFILDDQGWPKEIKFLTHGIAQEMIENFMLSANQAVTEIALEKKLPFLFRVHEKPSSDKIDEFKKTASFLQFPITKISPDISVKEIAQLLKQYENKPNKNMINLLILRMMSKARYDCHNIGHYGLVLNNYTHFTSPIRRYPDLIVHRIFWMFLFKPNHFSSQQKEQLVNQLNRICEIANIQERQTITLEQKANDIKTSQLMMAKIGAKYEGIVVGIKANGLFVSIDDNFCIEGFVKLANIVDGFYVYNETNNTFLNRDKGTVIFIGKKVLIQCLEINQQFHKIEFKLLKS